MIAPSTMGAKAPAALLNTPMILILLAALSIGPRMVIYGLEAVCNKAIPPPITNKPNKNKSEGSG
ncbi:MAG: hypothetical protein IPO25_23310 [Saprospiraceae bacterium]|nr:hypothetical protein [Saprospiraceae bacterium]